MSLPASQQRALDQIEKTLLAGDPRFGALFAIFTRLTWHEVIPQIELVKPGRWQSLWPFAAIALMLATVASLLILSLLAPSQPMCATSPVPGQGLSSGQAAGCTPGSVVIQEREYLH